MPTPYLVLTPDLVIADANPAYLATTGRALTELVGRDVFEAFPGNPNDSDPDGGVGKVRASFERARDTGRPHTMPVQEYDIPGGAGGFTKRFWSLISVPVLDGAGRCRYVLQRAEDITDYVREQAQAMHPAGTGKKWQRRVLEVESDLFARAAELRASREAEAETARRLAALSGVALALGRAETLDDLARVVTDLRSEEHTSELQSRQYLVCRLLLEKKQAIHGRSWRTMRHRRCVPRKPGSGVTHRRTTDPDSQRPPRTSHSARRTYIRTVGNQERTP